MACQAKDVRRTLSLLLTDQLGEYTLSNAATTPAIAVRAESERLPTGTKVAGLEVVVIRYPEQTPVRQYLDEVSENFWTVWLVGWDNTAKLLEAASILLTSFPGTEFQQINVPKAWGPTNQVKVTLRNPWIAPDTDLKDVDGGWFHPVVMIPATKMQAILDGGNFTSGATQDEWQGIVNP